MSSKDSPLLLRCRHIIMVACVTGVTLGAPLAAHAQGAGSFEVDEEAAERALERALVQAGTLLLPSGSFEAVPFFAYGRRNFQTGGPVVSVNDQPFASTVETRDNTFTTGVVLRAGLPWAAQVDVTLPFLVSESQDISRAAGVAFTSSSTNLSGIGDIRLTYSHALRAEGGGWPSLIGSASWDTDTGRTGNGVSLGSGFNELEFGISAAVTQDPLVFTGSIAYQRAFSQGGFRPGDQFTFSTDTFLAVNPDTSLSFGFTVATGQRARDNGTRSLGTDTFDASLDLGVATTLRRNVLLSASFSIGLTGDVPDFTAQVSLPIRFTF